MKVTYEAVSNMPRTLRKPTYPERHLQLLRRHHQTRQKNNIKHKEAYQTRSIHIRRQRQRVLQKHKLRPNDRSQNDLDRLAAPVHLDPEPDDGGHDPVDDGPETASHAPGGAAEDCEAKVLVGTGPAGEDSYEGADEGDADHDAHGLGHAEAEGEE